jgi:hypothetical protein
MNIRKSPRAKSSAGKTPKKSTSRQVDWLECVDALNDHCSSITTLAGLLEASGQHPESETLRADLAGSAGSLILREAEQMKEWLKMLAGQKGIKL